MNYVKYFSLSLLLMAAPAIFAANVAPQPPAPAPAPAVAPVVANPAAPALPRYL